MLTHPDVCVHNHAPAQEHGEQALYRETMLELCPDLFWNLWWYSARFGLPLPLPSRATTTTDGGATRVPLPQMLLLAGWDARVVERGAQAALATLHAFQGQRMGEG